jgi:hypothetical protein
MSAPDPADTPAFSPPVASEADRLPESERERCHDLINARYAGGRRALPAGLSSSVSEPSVWTPLLSGVSLSTRPDEPAVVTGDPAA